MTLPLEQVLPALRARWLAMLTAWIAIVAAVAALSLMLPPRYEASAVVAVEMGGADPIGGPAVFKPAGAVSTHVATQADILRSEEAALGVVRALKLQSDARWLERWQKATGGEVPLEPWIATQLLRSFEVRPSRDSNVLTLVYASPDAGFSAEVANAWVRSFADLTARMRAGPARENHAFFAERLRPLRDALEQARARLSAYEAEHGVSVGEPDVENARLAELTSQLTTLQDQAAEAAKIRRLAQAVPRDLAEVRNDPEVAVLTGELLRLQGQLAQLDSQYGERYPAVVQTREAIADVKARLEATLRSRARSLDAPTRVVEARLAEVRSAIERQRALVLERKSRRDAAAALVRDVENAQKAYDAVLQRASQTALESKYTAETTIAVLKSATPPMWTPATLMRNLVVGALGGLVAVLLAALFAEARNPRLRTEQDALFRLRQPVLLVLPQGESR